MASSISSSEEIVYDTRHALPFGLRLTAADRPGMAQPVPERDIPQQPWRAMALVVTVLVLLLTSLWEWKMRTLELVPGDLGESYDRWAELRRQVDKRDVPVVIIGDSRILFDTDLDRAAQLTGVRPLQLAIAGGRGLPILDLAQTRTRSRHERTYPKHLASALSAPAARWQKHRRHPCQNKDC